MFQHEISFHNMRNDFFYVYEFAPLCCNTSAHTSVHAVPASMKTLSVYIVHSRGMVHFKLFPKKKRKTEGGR